MNDGKTRAIDSRALAFLDRFNAKTEVVDALDYGLSAFIEKEVLDYFNPFVITAVFRVYAEELSYAREHPLTKRRYMWKLSY
jgi:fructoselysine-6-P-deglycase FrlB-like protein